MVLDRKAPGRWPWIVMLACVGCAPAAPARPDKPVVQTRQTLGKTTQNVLELSAALGQGGVLAPTSIQGNGLEVAAEAYRTQIGQAGVLAVQQKMSLHHAEHGTQPKTYEEFMARIIAKDQPDGIMLPMLPYYQEWAYDTEGRRLVVVEFPEKKQQRERETTGAAGL
jgi:hypothetical protein